MQDLRFSQQYLETYKSSGMLQRIDWKRVADVSEVQIPSTVGISSPRKSIMAAPIYQSICVTSRVTEGFIWTPVHNELAITDFTGIQAQI